MSNNIVEVIVHNNDASPLTYDYIGNACFIVLLNLYGISRMLSIGVLLLDDPTITSLVSLSNSLLMATTVPIRGRALLSRIHTSYVKLQAVLRDSKRKIPATVV